MRIVFALGVALAVSGCVAPTTSAPPEARVPAQAVPVSVARAIQVTQQIEPVAEAVCRSRTSGQNCDFSILVHRDPRAGVNAFQTVDPDTGRPVIILTLGLIRDVRNADELAFVIGHEAAHHVAEHLGEQRQAAIAGARIFGASAQQRGGNRAQIEEAANLGALLGARQFSQAAELEADTLGTLIACRAGFDPAIGSRFFEQLPDPGEHILGTHPPNAERVQAVRRVIAQHC